MIWPGGGRSGNHGLDTTHLTFNFKSTISRDGSIRPQPAGESLAGFLVSGGSRMRQYRVEWSSPDKRGGLADHASHDMSRHDAEAMARLMRELDTRDVEVTTRNM